MRYNWPGNVRELEHSLEHAFILCTQDIIVLEHLPVELQKFNLDNGIDDEYQTLLKALHQTRWNKTETATLLGVSRQSIYRRMKKYNMVNN
jgi:transcriptional regulator of acetoin/glycerol metabolism